MSSVNDDLCRLERQGDILIMEVSAQVEELNWDLIEHAAQLILVPIRQEECPILVIDITGVDFVGSVFLSLLLRCWKHISSAGGMMVICGASQSAQELLRVTQLANLWAIYDSRREAIAALEAD